MRTPIPFFFRSPAPSATLCAAFEALMGAIYMDQGLEVARAFVLPLLEDMLPQAVDIALHGLQMLSYQSDVVAYGSGAHHVCRSHDGHYSSLERKFSAIPGRIFSAIRMA